MCVPAAIGWQLGGHGIHLLGDHLRNVNIIVFWLVLCIAFILCDAWLYLVGSILHGPGCNNLGFDLDPDDIIFAGFPLSFVYVFIAFAVVSVIFHTDAPGEASRFLGIEHYSRLVCDWLALKF
jgi:hypothetical protein